MRPAYLRLVVVDGVPVAPPPPRLVVVERVAAPALVMPARAARRRSLLNLVLWLAVVAGWLVALALIPE